MVLQEKDVTILHNGVCKNLEGYGDFISSGTICASKRLRIEEDIGGGYSGGPLTVQVGI